MMVITGASGQLGKAFQKAAPNATFLGREDLDLSKMDLIEETVRKLKPSVLINCAAYTNVDGAEDDEVKARLVNAEAVGRMAKTCSELGSRFVTYSTDYVFSGNMSFRSHGYAEEDVPDPKSVYGLTKLAGERLALACPGTTVIRTSWVFGDGKNFVKAMLTLALEREIDPISVVDDQIGRPTYAPDLADTTLWITERREMNPKLIHVTNSGDPVSWAGFAEKIFRPDQVHIPRIKTKVLRITTEEFAEQAGKKLAPRPAYSVLDLSKLKDFGIPMRTWSEALGDYLLLAMEA